MYLYNLTLKPSTAISFAISGNFINTNTEQILLANNKLLQLIQLDDTANGSKFQTLISVDVFGTIRSLSKLSLHGNDKDYIVLSSDSGCISVLEYDSKKNVFHVLFNETFGKSGCRRMIPGQFLAVDPKGRAVMIGACEKQKFVYVFDRRNGKELKINSPLEAHKSHTFVYDIKGVDVGWENPIFAAIELDYSEADVGNGAQKFLTFYELDLSLNHVSRKWSEPIDNGTNMLVTVPGGVDGPGGVLVCAENYVIFKNTGHLDIRAVIPRRSDLPAEHGVLIVSATTYRKKYFLLFLLQSEYGDLFMCTLVYGKENVTELKIKYFDTLPVTSAMCILKANFLFAASEFGNHGLYEIRAIGYAADVESSSATLIEMEEGFQPVFFQPRRLQNLARIDQVESLMPVMDMKVANLFKEETPQIFVLCGRGPRSSLRILRPGLAVSERAVSQLPGIPSGVWTLKKNRKDKFDAYIVVSFANATLLLSIGETVEEISDSGFLDTVPSLCVSLLGEDSLAQIHPNGIRHIREDRRINEWNSKRTIEKVASNGYQVVIALAGGELVYFEMDMTGLLIEVERHGMLGNVACLDIAPVPEGRQRSCFLAVGSHDNTIRIFSLDPDDCMKILSVQSVSSPPESLLLLDVHASVGGEDGVYLPAGVFLNVGLQSGVLYRTVVDMVTGQLSDTRSRLLGLRAPKLFCALVRGRRALLCLSSKPWLGYIHGGNFLLTPLSYETLEFAASFSSGQCAEGVVAVTGDALRIFTIEQLGETFNETMIPLRYTPRKLVHHPNGKQLIVIESEQGAFSAEERKAARKDCLKAVGMEVNGNHNAQKVENSNDDEEICGSLSDEQYGYPKAESQNWVSCIRVIEPRTETTTCLLELQDNEAAFSVCTVNFNNKEYGMLLAVGTVKGLKFWPKRSHAAGFIHIYRFIDDGKGLQLLHKTQVEGTPLALCQFQGHLLAGIGPVLRLYDLGKRKLLRKCENKLFPHTIVSVHTCRDRIYVGDIQESFHFCKYRRDENQIYNFADDSLPRWLTASYRIDFDTMAGADKFGNIYFTRIPQHISDRIEEDPTGGKIKWEEGKLNGAPNKVEEIVQFHVGDTITCLEKTSLILGGHDCIVYGTVMGCIGALQALTFREDIEFFSRLEMNMRQEHPPLCGRDHLAYRSAYFPVKNVIDGDLCEQFSTLSPVVQKKIADVLDRRTPQEILKKLEDVRNKII
ncbi:hypothetical protein IFM89_039968 [Coptis chinensis]|uniref:Splicing factor 3B subunit 3 n=1 Tax=Coptis chinensis TaxID=261450 RepID=A0A835GU73_9MAGN|nr:hypothetical protein IFM89_039968 [Coptis chinensis]